MFLFNWFFFNHRLYTITVSDRRKHGKQWFRFTTVLIFTYPYTMVILVESFFFFFFLFAENDR